MSVVTDESSGLDTLPRWSVADLYESLDSRDFRAAVEQARADVDRVTSTFDRHEIRAIEPRVATDADGQAADEAIAALNELGALLNQLGSYVYATVSTDSRDERAQSLFAEVCTIDARVDPLIARLADWVSALHDGSGGLDRLAAHSTAAAEHGGPLLRLAARSVHQMTESEEGLYAELATVGSSSWENLQREVTSQLSVEVQLPSGPQRLPMPAVRGLANDGDAVPPGSAAYDAEMVAWPQVAVACAAAMNAIKGEATIVNRRRKWDHPLDASLFANAVSRPTFDAMQAAVTDSLGDFRRWMRAKASLHSSGSGGRLRWSDLVAPSPVPRRRCPGTKVSPPSVTPSPSTAPSSADSSRGRSTSNGSMPVRAKARRAERSACRSSAPDPLCC